MSAVFPPKFFMSIRFSASQSVEMGVAQEAIPIQHYLRQPQRLVNALVDPSRTEVLGANQFRLKMRPIQFMMLRIQPTVDIEVQVDANGVVHLRSTGCEIRGVEYINQRFNLDLAGRLVPHVQSEQHVMLVGKADLQVSVDLPPVFQFTPRSILETTGNGLLRGVLMTIKQRLINHLVSDYRRWVRVQHENADQAVSAATLPSREAG